MITFGFYDSINHDRRYNAVQFGSIFDGIVQDGIFMSIGACFRVIPSEGMMVLVGPGRAWFDHTWTLNDAPLPITMPQSEVLLDRIDAVVLDINANQESRTNSVMVVRGTPSKTPQRPTLIKTATHKQYPLAYINIRAGVTAIRAVDITSMVGTSATPYVTGVLETVNIDALLDQWQDQWQEFYEKQTAEIQATNDFWEKEWERWYEAQTKEIQDSYLAWEQEWTLWSENHKAMMEETADEWKNLWNAWFYSYTNQNEQMIATWQQDRETEFRTWFDSLKVILDGDVAANLAGRLTELESCCGIVKDFMTNLTAEYAVYDYLIDNGYDPQQDITDSDGHQIVSKVIFAAK